MSQYTLNRYVSQKGESFGVSGVFGESKISSIWLEIEVPGTTVLIPHCSDGPGRFGLLCEALLVRFGVGLSRATLQILQILKLPARSLGI